MSKVRVFSASSGSFSASSAVKKLLAVEFAERNTEFAEKILF
jgi:hypothetical protein